MMNRWLSSAGGIQTVNRELACGIVGQDPSIECVAVVAWADEKERAHAGQNGVSLIAGKSENDWAPALLSPELTKIRAEDVVAIVGHSYFSGDHAIDLRDRFFPRALSIQFIHMSPLDTESLKEYRADSYVIERERRLKKEMDIASRSDVVVCIGPRLSAYCKDQLAAKRAKQRVFRIDCGLKRPREERLPPVRSTVLCLGRADSLRVKGLDLFACAAGYLTKMWPESQGIRSLPAPKFFVRGAKEKPEELEKTLAEISEAAGARASI